MEFERRRSRRNISSECPVSDRVRMIISPCRSGSTVLIHSLSQSPQTTCYYQTIKSGIREAGRENYRIFFDDSIATRDSMIINKETFGSRTLDRCSFNPFPDEDAIFKTRPVFLFRDPLATWNSWLIHGWSNFQYFRTAYLHAFDQFRKAQKLFPDRVLLITIDQVNSNPESALKRICRHWGMGYDHAMTQWRSAFAPNTTVKGGADFEFAHSKGAFDAIVQSRGLAPVATKISLTDQQLQQLEGSDVPEVFKTIKEESLKQVS